jgi:valyl-tRNA synthetase
LPERALSVVAGGNRAFLPIEGLFDLEQELARLARERQETVGLLERCEQLLARPGFVERAPSEVVQRERDKADELRERQRLLDERLATLRELGANPPAG